MSNAGLYGFEIPHTKAQPVRDMVLIQIPFPPEKSKGGIITPDMSRDLMAHNVMAGRIISMGPLAFWYKGGDGTMQRHNAGIGDWVEFRPFAGTMVQGGTIMVTSGYRYISSFQDVIAVLPASEMPDPTTLEWEVKEDTAKPLLPRTEFAGQPREKIRVEK